MTNKAVLIILDGYGIAAPTSGNAIANAKKPNLDKLFASTPNAKLSASGMDVGLPEGQMGNSEVGHTNIGAGRVVFQILPKMTKEIEEGKFFENPAYVKCIDDAVKNHKPLHVMGLMSTGGVHSHLVLVGNGGLVIDHEEHVEHIACTVADALEHAPRIEMTSLDAVFEANDWTWKFLSR